MTNFRIATAFLLLAADFSASQPDGDCQPMESLGTPSLDRLGYSVSMDIEDCEYELKVTFKHDDTLPIPTDPMTQCNPANMPPELAPDNLPFFAFRWAYEALPEDIKKATGIDHVSIDWNPCGHPPIDTFNTPHFDLHFYRETPQFRTCMTCVTNAAGPDCDPTPGVQTSEAGQAFFNIASAEDEALMPAVIQRMFDPNHQPANMPPGFSVAMDSMIPHMGGHAWNTEQQPTSPAEWTTPIWTMGPYNGDIAFYEPMLPFVFMSGDEDKTFTENLTYEAQTITELPSSYTVDYDGTTKEVTITLTGTSVDETCEKKDLPVLPFIGDLIEQAYPTWCMDENENRLYDVESCEDGSPNGRFSPLYFTKQYSGGDPALGGYPTNIDINYAFEFAAPYLGQACAGSPHMCDETFDGTSTNCKKCPKLKTDHDNGPYGPGHVPPHISLAAVSRAYQEGLGGDISTWFDFNSNACRILPNKLLSLIRLYYPREDDGSAYYPPPFSDAGGAYPLEFVNLAGESCKKEGEKHNTAGFLDCFENHSGDISQFPDYLEVGHGSPHYCTIDGKAADVNPDYCPYIFFGPHRGKYRHPHIAFSAVEVYLSNLIMPENCGTTWDDSNYPAAVDTTVAFPYMSDVIVEGDDLVNHPQQPTINDTGMWIWPGPMGTMRKPVIGNFAVHLYTVKHPPMVQEVAPPVEEAPEETGEINFEWAAVFPVDDSTHTYIMQKVGGKYADPNMKVVMIPTTELSNTGIANNMQTANAMITGDNCAVIKDGETTAQVASGGSCFDLTVGTTDTTKFIVTTKGITGVAIFTAHVPYEFERDMHFWKDSAGKDIEPVAEALQEGGHAHSHAGHGHGHEEHSSEDSGSTALSTGLATAIAGLVAMVV